MIVRVRHPSPVSHRPPGARIRRDGFVSLATPVRIVAIDESRLDPDNAWNRLVGFPSLCREALESDGVLWRPLEAHSCPGHWKGGPIHPETLVRFLESGPEEDWLFGIAPAFDGSPLVAHWRRPGPYGSRIDVRERGLEPGRIGEVFEAEEARTRAALERFVAEEIRIGSDAVYRRIHPLARRTPSGGAAYGVMHETSIDPDALLPVPVRADRHAVATAFWRGDAGHWAGTVHPAWHPGTCCDDGDLDMLANIAPSVASTWITAATRIKPAIPPDLRHPEEDLGRAALHQWAMLGRVAAVLGDDRMHALRAVVAARDLLRAHSPYGLCGPEEWGGIDALAAYIEREAIPRIAAIPSDDLDAIAALGP